MNSTVINAEQAVLELGQITRTLHVVMSELGLTHVGHCHRQQDHVESMLASLGSLTPPSVDGYANARYGRQRVNAVIFAVRVNLPSAGQHPAQ